LDAVILVDVQNDFMPFGALPVAEGDRVVPVCNALARAFELVVATQDWHPPDHASFASKHEGAFPGDVIDLDGIEQVLWPDHCVQNMPGASFHSGLDVARLSHVTRKGTDPRIDSYSGFFDNNHLKATDLEGYLREREVDHVIIAGLALDYCVLYTALDARGLGFMVTLATDGTRAVDREPGDGQSALDTMREAGCVLRASHEIVGGRV